MASRRVAAIRQGDLGVDREHCPASTSILDGEYVRCYVLGGVVSSVHDRIRLYPGSAAHGSGKVAVDLPGKNGGFSFSGSIKFTVNKSRELPSAWGSRPRTTKFQYRGNILEAYHADHHRKK
ncbi:hypothetical protein EJB05_15902, partial [Eragrostis curvula]